MNCKFGIRNYLLLPLSFMLFGSNIIYSQSIFDYKGYLTNMESVWMLKDGESTFVSGTAQNRLDFSIYPMDNTAINIGVRNIIEYGNTVSYTPGFTNYVTHDNGYYNLTKAWKGKKSYVFYSSIDRLNLFFSTDNYEIQLGRQRVNWGVNLVWTPNDIFNSSSYLNFDYEEKQGSDAVRGQYYFNYSSSLEYVYKLDYSNRITSSLMYRFNVWNYDFQTFVGMMGNDYVFGGGWSGNILSSNISGEVTYFRDKENFADTTGQLVASLGWTYTFASDFYIHSEFLFNSTGKTEKAGGVTNLLLNEYNAKNLSPAKYSIFAELAYQLNPLIRLDFSGILNPTDKSFYLGSFATASISQTIDLLFAGQFFFGDTATEWGEYGTFYYLKLKWNF